MRTRPVWILALVAGLAAPGAAPAAERPTAVDIAACREVARAQRDIPAYTETAPANPFPARLSHVGPWTGPVTATPAPLPLRPVELPAPSAGVGAGGGAEQPASEPGPVDPPFQDAFDACMRARGF